MALLGTKGENALFPAVVTLVNLGSKYWLSNFTSCIINKALVPNAGFYNADTYGTPQTLQLVTYSSSYTVEVGTEITIYGLRK